MSDVLHATKVTKRFGGLLAVNNVDFTIPEQAIVSLIGPNGAGKTTFFNIIAGIYDPTAGRIDFQGSLDATAPMPVLLRQWEMAPAAAPAASPRGRG